jgi:hypothetical protein
MATVRRAFSVLASAPVLLELVVRTFQAGATPEAIVQSDVARRCRHSILTEEDIC